MVRWEIIDIQPNISLMLQRGVVDREQRVQGQAGDRGGQD